jgi:hypothetical protein
MRIRATVVDSKGRFCCSLWLNGASEHEEPLCLIENCDNALEWSYPYCPAHLKEIFGVAVAKSKVHGMGLFAMRDFAKGERVVPFGGDFILSQKELNKRYSATGSSDCTAAYAIHIKGRGYVDALRLRHAWVYANQKQSSPNCELTWDGIRTRQKVRAGQELLVDYGDNFGNCDTAKILYEIYPC